MTTKTAAPKKTKAVAKPKTATKKASTKKTAKPAEKSVAKKIQSLIAENEETIQLLVEIATITIDQTKLSKKQKKIAHAALNLLSEVLIAE